MRKLFTILALLLCCALPALALELPEVDESADDLIMLDDDQLIDRYADTEEAASDYIVMPEGQETSLNSSFTILLIGSDSYTDDHRGRGDALILVQVNGTAREIRMVSFMRDLYVPIPGKGSNRINASYVWGGEKLLRQTIENSFGVKADAYMEVNFERMVKLIDGIGGVDVEVSEKERVQVNSILRFYNTQIGDPEEDQLLEESGLVHLTGKQALCFSRIRKIDGDIQRTGRQRKVLEAAFRKVAAMDIASITGVIIDNLDAVTTDLTLADCVTLIPLAMQCRNASIETLTIPQDGHGAYVDGAWVMKARNMKNEKKALLEFLGREAQ
ncbi:MAG: LCP family protein [Christensenellaceae bacterium]|nr:LCP family protein [Christensenellaceae bacterium]